VARTSPTRMYVSRLVWRSALGSRPSGRPPLRSFAAFRDVRRNCAVERRRANDLRGPCPRAAGVRASTGSAPPSRNAQGALRPGRATRGDQASKLLATFLETSLARSALLTLGVASERGDIGGQ
jgi:hypothetical protein